ncbi:MAG: MBOAT family protein, partial [Bacteroidetes bacterium]|nr:MBOAT family protein [Bacteroidota bacterium]
MVFSSITFLFYFLPALLLVYWVCPERFRNLILLLGSAVFYAWGAPKFVFVLLASTVVDFYIVQAMANARLSSKRKQLLSLSILLNLGLLAWFKYANFFVNNIQSVMQMLGSDSRLPWMEIALPIGISFYTFQTLTYAVDVYRGTHTPLRKVSDYVLYIIMFPQLIAGPIVRFHEIADELTHRSFLRQDILDGINRFVIGLAKKVLIANVLAEHIDDIFRADFATLPTGMAWLAILGYTF